MPCRKITDPLKISRLRTGYVNQNATRRFPKDNPSQAQIPSGLRLPGIEQIGNTVSEPYSGVRNLHQMRLELSSTMPDETPAPTTVNSPEPSPAQPPMKFNIGEEFGTAKKNLPPAKIVVIGVAILAVAAGIFALLQRPQSSATGSIDQMVSVEIPNQGSVMVALNVSFRNNGSKPFWIHTIKADLETATGTFSDTAASPVDFDRYYQAFPPLKQYAIAPLQIEAKINPGDQTQGSLIFSFPVTPDAFANRKLLKVSIQPYDQPAPLVLSK